MIVQFVSLITFYISIYLIIGEKIMQQFVYEMK